MPLPALLPDRSAELAPEPPEFEALVLAELAGVDGDDAGMAATLQAIENEIASGAAELPGARALVEEAATAFGASPAPALEAQRVDVDVAVADGDADLAEFDAELTVEPPPPADSGGGGTGGGGGPVGGGGGGGGPVGGGGGGPDLPPMCDPDLIARGTPCVGDDVTRGG